MGFVPPGRSSDEMTSAARQTMCLLAAVWLAAVACGPSTGDAMRIMAQQRPYFPDVPVPMGFQLVPDASEDSMTGRRRLYARHVYVGRADIYAVKNFYQDRMPQYKWHMVNDIHVAGVHDMRFEKGQESCSIRISPPKSGWGGKVHVQIIIMQEERGTADRKRAS